MYMPEVEGLDMAEERLSTWAKVEGMYIVDIHMLEVEDNDMAEERTSKQRPEVEGKDTVEERPSKRWLEVEGMDMTGIHMVEDMTVKVERVERGHGGMELVKHRIGDGAERHQQTHWKQELRTW
jgi:hypothetical protein